MSDLGGRFGIAATDDDGTVSDDGSRPSDTALENRPIIFDNR